MLLLKNCYYNIKRHKESFFSSIYSMIVVFILINLLVFGLFSLNAYKKENLNSNQIIIYLNSLSDEEKEKIQQQLLDVNGVLSLRYESKDTALEAVSKELGIELSKDDNPLNDAIYAYVDDDVELTQLKNKLETFPEISDIDLRTTSIQLNREFNSNLNTFITIFMAIIIVFAISMINHLSSSAVKSREKHIAEELGKGITERKIQTEFFVETIFAFIISYILGFIIYSKLKTIIYDLLKNINSDYIVKRTFIEELYTSILIILIAIVISAFVNYIGLKRYYNRNKIKEEIKEEVIEEITETIKDTKLPEITNEEIEEEIDVPPIISDFENEK